MALVNHKPNYHHSHKNVNRHNNRGDHLKTNYIAIQSQYCTSCGTCIKECPRGVIGKIRFFGHKHAHIDNADACIGCKKCIKACPSKAIIEIPNNDRPKRKETNEQEKTVDHDWANTVLDLLK